MDKYDEIRCIGRGTYGSAHLVTLRHSGERFVVKKIPTELLTEKEKAQAFREVELLAKLKHPNVVEYRESFVHANVIHIVMAYCDGGDLADKIRDRVTALETLPSGAETATERRRAYFPISQILDWFVQMAMAIKYLHQQRILHRDLKTSNIFLTTENVIKLGDFGIAKTLDSTLDQARTVVGTPYYMSPEVCENKPYSYASDVWSLGCVLYEMCALKHAFDAPNIISLIFTIVRKEVRLWVRLSAWKRHCRVGVMACDLHFLCTGWVSFCLCHSTLTAKCRRCSSGCWTRRQRSARRWTRSLRSRTFATTCKVHAWLLANGY